MDMSASISGKQFICHFREVGESLVYLLVFLLEMKKNDSAFLYDDPKRKSPVKTKGSLNP